ncbi:hypothetical protein ACFPOU_09755 [Massilia jejuensis]|uniref:Uncharacterized protein n=1 Tax=Massilia jejuensis TaxID=648894 RepID=A0ABW0PH41_9BURK
MPKRLRYMVLAIAIVAALMWMKHERDADACRKAGGQWDDAASACVPAAPAGGRPA